MLRRKIQIISSGYAAIAIIAEPALSQSPKAASGTVRSMDRMKQNTTGQPNEKDVCLEESVDLKDIRRIIEKHNGKSGKLMAILADIQFEYRYLPEESLRMVADEMDYSLVDIYGVATFYRSFSLKPRGKHIVCACLGTACHVRGAARIVDELEQQLGIKAGQTTPDKEFTLETVNCLGACAIGPVVTVNGYYFSKVNKAKVKHILDEVRAGLLQDEEFFADVSE